MAKMSIKDTPKKTNDFRCITFYANKGGDGKTTSAVMFASILAAKGYKVILIDNDGQANSSDFSGADIIPREGIIRTENLYAVINKNTPSKEERIDTSLLVKAIQETEIGYAFIESSKLLDSVHDSIKGSDIIFTLWRITRALRNAFDFCIIDCPCKEDVLSANAIIASDDIIVTAATEGDTYKTLTNTFFAFGNMEKKYGAKAHVDRVLPVKIRTQYHASNTIATIEDFAKTNFKSKATKSYIKFSTDIENALTAREKRIECIKSGRSSDAFIAYIEVVEEYLKDHMIEDNSDFTIMEVPLIESITKKEADGTDKKEILVGESFKKKIVTDKKEPIKEYISCIRNFLKGENIDCRFYTQSLSSGGEKTISGIIVEMGKKKGKNHSNEDCYQAVSKYLADTGLEYSVRKVL